ncbi:MAG: excisionase family DNA-binding protein [Actinomycetota bacterium]
MNTSRMSFLTAPAVLLAVLVAAFAIRDADDARLLVDVREAANRLSLGRTTVYELINRGDLESVRVGRSRLIPSDALTAFVDRVRREQRTDDVVLG